MWKISLNYEVLQFVFNGLNVLFWIFDIWNYQYNSVQLKLVFNTINNNWNLFHLNKHNFILQFNNINQRHSLLRLEEG